MIAKHLQELDKNTVVWKKVCLFVLVIIFLKMIWDKSNCLWPL